MRALASDEGEVAQFLASRGLLLTNAASARFLDFVVVDLAAALRALSRRAGGDYSADQYRARFPTAKAIDTGLTPWQLFERWVAERKPAASTVENWRSYFRDLQKQFPDRSAGSIHADEADAWVRSLPTGKRTASAVRNTWLKAFKSVFNWGVKHKLVPSNPFAGIEITVSRKLSLRETKAFHAGEAATILKAAADITDTNNPDEAAKRWVPWICAYTGARPAEITQLRGQDVTEEQGILALKLTPEAGTIKETTRTIAKTHQRTLVSAFHKRRSHQSSYHGLSNPFALAACVVVPP